MFSEVGACLSTIDDFTGDVPADDLLPEVTDLQAGVDSLTIRSGRVTGLALVMERSSPHHKSGIFLPRFLSPRKT
ncbi:unnamed protein product [Rhizophagus irregularis]|nr:unnamed protein product [Rhizophagus irregularis]